MKRKLYSIHPTVIMVQNWIKTLPEKTGKGLEEWIDFIKKHGPKTEKECREWLKNEHGLGTNTAWWLTERSEGKGALDGDPNTYLEAAEKYVEDMFSGRKSHLRPIYDALLELGLNLGPEVKVCPCKTIVPFYRKHVFAQIKPTTQTRIDLGLALKDLKPTGKLVETGGFEKKDRITHRIPIKSLSEINDEVKYWMRYAYDAVH